MMGVLKKKIWLDSTVSCYRGTGGAFDIVLLLYKMEELVVLRVCVPSRLRLISKQCAL